MKHNLQITRIAVVRPNGEVVDLLSSSEQALLRRFISRETLDRSEFQVAQEILTSLRVPDGTQFGLPGSHLVVTRGAGPVNETQYLAPAIAGHQLKWVTLRDLTREEMKSQAEHSSQEVADSVPKRRRCPRPRAGGIFSFHRNVRVADDVERKKREKTGDRETPVEDHVESTLCHLLRSASHFASQQLLTSDRSYLEWWTELRDSFGRYTLVSGKTLAEVISPVADFDPESAAHALLLDSHKWREPHIPHRLVLGIVDHEAGEKLEVVNGASVLTFHVRDKVLRPGRTKTPGPYLFLGTVTLDPDNPKVAVIRKGVLHPVVSHDCPCLVDSHIERCVVDLVRHHGQALWPAGYACEKVLYPVEFLEGESAYPDLCLSRGAYRLFVEIMGKDDPEYRDTKERQRETIMRYASYFCFDAVRVTRRRLVLLVRALLQTFVDGAPPGAFDAKWPPQY